jgi:YVTN family beta-propeller protein
VPVDGHASGLGASPDGSRLYISSRKSSSYLDWRGSISVIDTDTYRVVHSIALELAPDTVTVSRDGLRLYATHYHKNSTSIIELETRALTRRVLRDAPIDVAVSPDDAFAYATNLHSLAVIDTAANVAKVASVGALPRATDFSADGKHAYTVDFAQQSIRAIDTADNSVVGSVQLEGHPDRPTSAGELCRA